MRHFGMWSPSLCRLFNQVFLPHRTPHHTHAAFNATGVRLRRRGEATKYLDYSLAIARNNRCGPSWAGRISGCFAARSKDINTYATLAFFLRRATWPAHFRRRLLVLSETVPSFDDRADQWPPSTFLELASWHTHRTTRSIRQSLCQGQDPAVS